MIFHKIAIQTIFHTVETIFEKSNISFLCEKLSFLIVSVGNGETFLNGNEISYFCDFENFIYILNEFEGRREKIVMAFGSVNARKTRMTEWQGCKGRDIIFGRKNFDSERADGSFSFRH